MDVNHSDQLSAGVEPTGASSSSAASFSSGPMVLGLLILVVPLLSQLVLWLRRQRQRKLATRFPVLQKLFPSSFPPPNGKALKEMTRQNNSSRQRRKCLTAAHRGGASCFAPENTLHAFQKALDSGVELLELDVRTSKDGHLFLLHDPTLERTTDGFGMASDKTLKELQSLDAAYHFSPNTQDYTARYPLRNKGHRIPTLEEVFDLVDSNTNREVCFLLDIKDERTVEPTLALVKERGLEERVILGAVVPSVNDLVRRHKPAHVPLCPHYRATLWFFLLSFLRLHWLVPFQHDIFGTIYGANVDKALQARGNKLSWRIFKLIGRAFLFDKEGILVNDRVVKHAHSLGKMLFVFGADLDEAPHIRRCMRLGVDCVMSDRPDFLMKIVKEEEEEGAKTE
ncbi:Glycerophosphodiester phosphodiesterase [Balamuthia mandrillaris]